MHTAYAEVELLPVLFAVITVAGKLMLCTACCVGWWAWQLWAGQPVSQWVHLQPRNVHGSQDWGIQYQLEGHGGAHAGEDDGHCTGVLR